MLDFGLRTPDQTHAYASDVRDGTTTGLDRAYSEVLQEVRIAQCGIQFLFASLLALGVTPAFGSAGPFQRTVYCVALACAIGAAGTLLAPAAMHRVMAGDRVKRELLGSAQRCLVAGLVFLALAISAALVLILDIALGTTTAITGGAAALLWFALLWLLGPLRTRRRARARQVPWAD
jgi:low temperature requirement protein LtrA